MTQKENPAQSSRDLGSVGGGSIPNPGPPPENRPSEVVETTDQNDSAYDKNSNNIDATAQTNLGGRNPGEPRNAMGDQDRTRSRPGDDPSDPMTSRDPHKVNQQQSDPQK